MTASAAAKPAPILVARDVVAGYEPGLAIVDGASLAVAPGEIGTAQHWVGCSRGCGTPTHAHVRVEAISDADFTTLASGLRPALQGVDPAYDRHAAGRLAALGADGLLTGQGGDSVFFQAPDPLVAADRFRRLIHRPRQSDSAPSTTNA